MALLYYKSRYRQTSVLNVPVHEPGSTNKIPERYDSVFERRLTNFYSDSGTVDFIVKEGDTLFDIAFRAYDDNTLWWIIADFNPQLYDLFNIPAGTSIIVPKKNIVDTILGLT